MTQLLIFSTTVLFFYILFFITTVSVKRAHEPSLFCLDLLSTTRHESHYTFNCPFRTASKLLPNATLPFHLYYVFVE